MGRHRTEIDDAVYEARRARYIERRTKILQRAKERYAQNKDIISEVGRRVRAEIKAAEEERRAVKEIQQLDVSTQLKEQPTPNPLSRTGKAGKFVREYKEHHPTCQDCRHDFPPYVLDFDHVRGQKGMEISRMVQRGRSVKALIHEIRKCELVCANCHRVRTFTKRIKNLSGVL